MSAPQVSPTDIVAEVAAKVRARMSDIKILYDADQGQMQRGAINGGEVNRVYNHIDLITPEEAEALKQIVTPMLPMMQKDSSQVLGWNIEKETGNKFKDFCVQQFIELAADRFYQVDDQGKWRFASEEQNKFFREKIHDELAELGLLTDKDQQEVEKLVDEKLSEFTEKSVHAAGERFFAQLSDLAMTEAVETKTYDDVQSMAFISMFSSGTTDRSAVSVMDESFDEKIKEGVIAKQQENRELLTNIHAELKEAVTQLEETAKTLRINHDGSDPYWKDKLDTLEDSIDKFKTIRDEVAKKIADPVYKFSEKDVKTTLGAIHTAHDKVVQSAVLHPVKKFIANLLNKFDTKGSIDIFKKERELLKAQTHSEKLTTSAVEKITAPRSTPATPRPSLS